MPQIIDYSDTDYKKEFWQSADRRYEDLADKHAVKNLLPKTGNNFVELGAGFGRLCVVYKNQFKKIILFDYAQNLLDQAKETFKDYAHIEYKQGSIYELPFADNSVENILMVRVTHHLEALPKALKEVYRILAPGGCFVLEYANKKHFLEILRYVFQREKMSNGRGQARLPPTVGINPFSLEPHSRNEKGFYNYHPKYIQKIMQEIGFKIKKTRSVSNFRNNIFKKLLPPKLLLLLDTILNPIFTLLHFGPSIYLKAKKVN